ncbi:ribosomal-processing cysteine protease Prp [Clostridium sp. OS1-26]|uniref:ribosomal-processing cysteine protease Prp n=1 Tax=Clostridium sp. OS1-26 TaxID=3070681 RepID=UPI0027E1667F|nr:ribosomal-processing cysteine protease Prp [Clostridium sp. OS1-26]WML34331.1 ribosomal-processing cysteine protease Prp [Clostridium sp. OS1-26]
MNRKYNIIILILIILIMTVGCSQKTFDGNIETNSKEFSLESYKSNEGVTAFFFSNKEGIIYKFIIYGVTNYSEEGKDIVAAGVSALSINTINSINKLTDTKINYTSKEINLKPYLECQLNKFNSKQGKDETIVLIKALKLGLEDIEKAYGSKYIHLVEISDK